MHAEAEEQVNASEPVRQALQLIRAIRDSRVPDLLAVVHPDVTCEPLLRPGLTLYHGYEDMARFTDDMHAVHGRYQIEIGTITEYPGPEVVLHSTIVPEPARSTLNKIRAVIRSVVPPEATETISYRIPAFRHKEVLVWLAAFSDHCSLFPTAAVIANTFSSGSGMRWPR